MPSNIIRRYSLFDFPERLAARRRFLAYALLLLLTVALYGPSLYYGFVWDDYYYILLNYRIQGLSRLHLNAIWTATYMGHYAPIQHMFFAFLYPLAGSEPFGYHLGQLLLHLACVLLVYFLLQRIESPRVALLATLLFAVHPTNVETVAWVSETKSTLAGLFFLLSFLAFLRQRERGGWGYGVWCAVFQLFSLLAKINTVVAPAIFLLWDYRQRRSFDKKTIASLGCFFVISAILTRVHLLSFMGSEGVDESAYYGGLGVHLMNLPVFLFFYLQMILVPHPLSAWYMFPIALHWNGTLAALWVALLALAWLLLRSGRQIQFWGLWFLVFLGPVLQIIPFGIWAADRYLYLPAIGLFVLGSRFFFQLWERFGRVWARWSWEAAMCAILLVFAWRTETRLPVWKDDLTLWETTLPTCPTSAYCHEALGLALMKAGQTQRGGDELVQAAGMRPAPKYLVNLADALTLSARDYPEAIRYYRLALQDPWASSPSPWVSDCYAGLARAYILQGNLEEAAQAIEKGKSFSTGNPRLWVAEGFLHWKRGDPEALRRSLGIALMITGQTTNLPDFFLYYWGNAADVGELRAYLLATQKTRPVSP